MSVPIFRYWNAATSDHHYTAGHSELHASKAGEQGHHGYLCEGIAFSIFKEHHHGLVPVYRYWNEGYHDHFFTANVADIGTTTPGHVGHGGWKCESVLGYISPHEFPGSVPVYRYWHDHTHDHFYTTNAAEIGTTSVGHVGNHGYKYEGILGFAYPADHHVYAVYRYYHEHHHDHFYTTNQGEIGTVTPGAVGNHGYKAEGIAFYIFHNHHQGLVPVYRYWNDGKQDHFYTTNAGEIGVTEKGHVGNHGYKSRSFGICISR
jgi:Fe2+ or Zn2+ uptake regulation protein